MLSFAHTKELARMGHDEFGQLLGERKVIRHEGEEEIQEDLDYARGE